MTASMNGSDLGGLLVCPIDRQDLVVSSGQATCSAGHSFPVVDGIPVLLPDGIDPTHETAVARTMELVKARGDRSAGSLEVKGDGVDPFVQREIAAAAGRLFRNRIGRLERYPVPDFPVSSGHGRLLLDVGCNWGRWSLAATRRGFLPVGIDPSLEAVAAARRVAQQLGMPAAYVVGDARCLPFRDRGFEFVFSYSVIQHFSWENAAQALSECARILRPGSEYLIQMANRYGAMSLYHQARRGFRAATSFEVRYWKPSALRDVFSELFGRAELEVDGFLGLGVGASRVEDITTAYRPVVRISRLLGRLSASAPALRLLADSLYVHGVRTG